MAPVFLRRSAWPDLIVDLTIALLNADADADADADAVRAVRKTARAEQPPDRP